MNDIRIPYWRSRGRGFESHLLQWRTWCTNVHSYIENANSPIFVDGDWTSWNSTTFTLSVIKDCDDIEDDRKNNFKKKKYIYLKP